MNPEDPKLRNLLREARVSPSLPPRFQENVWRRIEDAETAAKEGPGWLNTLVFLVLRPRFACATAVILILAGAVFGAHAGSKVVKQDAEARYIASVAPSTLR